MSSPLLAQMEWTGQTVAGMVIVLLAMVSLVCVEYQRRKARREKDVKADLLRAVITHAHIGVTITCVSGPLSKANPAFCKMLGYSEAELVHLGWGAISHPQDHEAARDAVQGLSADEVTTSFLCRYLHEEGHYVPAYVNVTLVPGAGQDGADLQVAQIQDINEFNRVIERTPADRREMTQPVSLS
jgi:PAS domain S-box-containing protein